MKGILFIDDDVTFLATLARRFGTEHCWYAPCVDMARMIIKTQEVCCVVTDVHMPQETGLEFSQWLEKSAPDIQVIMMSSLYPSQDLPRNVKNFLIKPFRTDELHQSLQAVVFRNDHHDS